MKITSDTRISELIKENKGSIDTIASLAKVFEKLKNPLLRKLMASRVSISEAANMGGIKLQKIIEALLPLGFEYDEADNRTQKEEIVPTWLDSLKGNQIDNFDVREMLASGNDPLKEIMKRFKLIEAGNALCIINTFVPTPLVRLLEKDNVLSYTKNISANEFHTYFYKQPLSFVEKKEKKESSKVYNESKDEFLSSKNKYSKDNLIELDVRHLEMPGPMETILAALAQLPNGSALYVHHKRVPIYLLDELEEQGYNIHIYSQRDTDVKMLFERN